MASPGHPAVRLLPHQDPVLTTDGHLPPLRRGTSSLQDRRHRPLEVVRRQGGAAGDRPRRPGRGVARRLGGSGAGKSVLLKHLIGLISRTGATSWSTARTSTRASPASASRSAASSACAFQEGALFDSMTVFENIAFPLRRHTRMHTGRDRGAGARVPRAGPPRRGRGKAHRRAVRRHAAAGRLRPRHRPASPRSCSSTSPTPASTR